MPDIRNLRISRTMRSMGVTTGGGAARSIAEELAEELADELADDLFVATPRDFLRAGLDMGNLFWFSIHIS
jgi:hypothetical protein